MPAVSVHLSIIVPAYNEERRLPSALDKVFAYLATKSFTAEVLVVDDGSTDRTPEILAERRTREPRLRVIRHERNRGKGASVRTGMLAASGRLALFTDTDLSAPIEEADKLLAAIHAGAEIAFGSRALDRSLIQVRQSTLRELGGQIFNWFVRRLIGLPFADTQCGFKLFVLERARSVFEQQTILHFGFDPEILFLAQRRGLTMREVPVVWSHSADTRLYFFRDAWRMFLALLRIRWNALVGRYA